MQFVFNNLNRKSKKELIKRLIENIEIKRDKNYDIEIINIKFTEKFISKSSKNYKQSFFVFSNIKIVKGEYNQEDFVIYIELH